MKTGVILLLMIGVVCTAQLQKSDGSATPAKRLESVTWDLKSHKLQWMVQNGKVANGQFEGESTDRYEISPNDGVMAFGGQRRGFSPQEAIAVQKLLDTLSIYCAESVIWWDRGEGVKLDENGNPDGDSIHDPAPKKTAPAGRNTAMLR
jgi:hypothetical protein